MCVSVSFLMHDCVFTSAGVRAYLVLCMSVWVFLRVHSGAGCGHMGHLVYTCLKSVWIHIALAQLQFLSYKRTSSLISQGITSLSIKWSH